MSGKYWLERDPKDSPGLQRIQEAQRAAVLAKAQEAQRAREAGVAVREAEQKRLEMLARIEQKTAQVLPLLEEIRDFANQTKTYPLGEYDPVSLRLKEGNPQLVVQANTSRTRKEILPERQTIPLDAIPDPESMNIVKDIEERIDLQYGFLGTTMEAYSAGYGDDYHEGWRPVPATINYGISLKIKGTSGEIEILRQKRVTIPTQSLGKGGRIVEHEETVDDWKILPAGEAQRKLLLSEAFHNPVCLGVGELSRHQEIVPQPELGPQESAGIGSLVKGLLGLK